jgi:tetratricopeptide (TPR) repeat protein
MNVKENDAYDWIDKGVAFSKLGKHSEAIECFDKALKLKPDYTDVWNIKGLTLHNLKKHSKAIECYNKAIELDSGNKMK